MEVCPAYISKDISNQEIQIILLMIPNEKYRHYLAVNKMTVLLRGINKCHESV